jgi:hypothetical protein
MAYPISGAPWNSVTAANPAYSGTFIPEIWSGRLIEKFYASTVLAAISNTNYEGEIKNQGDKVIIRTKPTLSINNYEATQTLTFQRPSSNVVELAIDKGKYFAAVVDDVIETQADMNLMSLWADDAAEQMKLKIDTDVLTALCAETTVAGSEYVAISSVNKGATAGAISGSINLGTEAAPIIPTADTIIDLLVDMGQVLDEQNIPETGRWIIIPAWISSMIKKSDLKDASLAGDSTSMLRNGRLGMIDRFTLYSSNLMPRFTYDTNTTQGGIQGSNNGSSLLFGHSHGFTFASQFSKVETLRAESTFGTILRGLQIYGHRVIDGTALGVAKVGRTAIT